MIDEILDYFGDMGWHEINEMTEILERYDLTKSEVNAIQSFVIKYLIVLDTDRQRAKLTPWLYKLLKP